MEDLVGVVAAQVLNQSAEKDCPMCLGTGRWHGMTCVTCDGSGQIR